MAQGSAQRSLAAIVLGFEVVVVFLGGLVAFGLDSLPAPIALIGGGGFAVLLLVTIALLRYRWAYPWGWVLHAGILATGFVLTAMFIVGGIFAALWAYATIMGARLDRASARAAELLDDTTDDNGTEKAP